VKPVTRRPTFLYGLPVDDNEDVDVQAEPPASAEPPPSAAAPPVAVTPAARSPSSPPALPLDNEDDATTASTMSTPTVVARSTTRPPPTRTPPRGARAAGSPSHDRARRWPSASTVLAACSSRRPSAIRRPTPWSARPW